MPPVKIVVTHWIHQEVKEFLLSFADELITPDSSQGTFTQSETLHHAADAHALITCMADYVDEALLVACSHLRIIAATLKGCDNYDIEACSKRRVWLTTISESIIQPTAELALSLTLGLLRRVREGDILVRSGKYAGWRPQLYGTSLSGATVGLVGMGKLGNAIADILDGFALAETLYADPAVSSMDRTRRHDWKPSNLPTLMRRSNVIIVCLPLQKETHHLIDAEKLSYLDGGNHCHLINVGRGSVIDEQAILEALNSGILQGFATDVYEFEDWTLPTRPKEISTALRQHPQTLFTPHLGSAVDGVRKEMSMESASQVYQVLIQWMDPAGAVNSIRST